MAPFWPIATLAGIVASGCATQADNGDMSDGSAASSTGATSTGGGGSGSGGSSAGSSKGGMSSAGTGTSGSGNAGTNGSGDGGSAGMAMGGASAGSAAGGGKGGSAGSAGGGGKGGAGGSGGSAGVGGKGGSGGMPQVDACKNGKLDANEADSDCGGVCSTKCANGKMCDTVHDCVLGSVCDDSKCAAAGCATGSCAFALTRFVIASSGVHGQAIVTWDSDSLDFDLQIFDNTPQDDSPENWKDDSVEIYLDLNHSDNGAYDGDDFQITVPRANGALSGLGTFDQNAITVARTSDAMGYTLKVSIPWGALNGATSKVGSTIGFDLSVNDDTDAGDRNAQLMLYGNDQNYNHTSDFGDLTLTP